MLFNIYDFEKFVKALEVHGNLWNVKKDVMNSKISSFSPEIV